MGLNIRERDVYRQRDVYQRMRPVEKETYTKETYTSHSMYAFRERETSRDVYIQCKSDVYVSFYVYISSERERDLRAPRVRQSVCTSELVTLNPKP